MNALEFRIKNFRKIFIPGLKQRLAKPIGKALGVVTMGGRLDAVWIRGEYRKAPKSVDLGCLGYQVVTNAGVDFMATDFFDGSVDITTTDFHDAGTGNTAENVTDIALQTPWGGARVSGTPTHPSAGLYRTVGTITFTGTFAIVEHGIFTASTSTTLWDRTVFSAINVVNTDAIQFTYTLTINAGG